MEHLRTDARHLRAFAARQSVARALRPYLRGKMVGDAPAVAAQMVRDWSGTLATATINRRLALLRRLCNRAYDWGWTETQMGRRVKLLPGEATRETYLTAAEVERLTAAHKAEKARADAAEADARRWRTEIDLGRFTLAPCYICGYNGPGYYQPDTHPCAAHYHAIDAAIAAGEKPHG